MVSKKHHQVVALGSHRHLFALLLLVGCLVFEIRLVDFLKSCLFVVEKILKKVLAQEVIIVLVHFLHL